MAVRRRLVLGVLTVATLVAGAGSAGAATEPGTVPGSCDPKFATCIDHSKAGCDYVKSCQPPGMGVKSSYCFVTVDDIMLCRD